MKKIVGMYLAITMVSGFRRAQKQIKNDAADRIDITNIKKAKNLPPETIKLMWSIGYTIGILWNHLYYQCVFTDRLDVQLIK
jgi:hypothetical protein